MSSDVYIRAQDAIDAVHEEFDGCTVWDESGERTADEVELIIDRVSPANVVPVVRVVTAYTWGNLSA